MNINRLARTVLSLSMLPAVLTAAPVLADEIETLPARPGHQKPAAAVARMPKELGMMPRKPIIAPKDPAILPRKPIIAPKDPAILPRKPIALPQPANGVEGVLKDLPLPFDTLKSGHFSQIMQHRKAYKASITVLGQTATAFVYSPNGNNEYIIAVALPDQLTADKLFGVGSALDVGLNKPVLFWLKKGGTIETAKMPAELKTRVDEMGMPGHVIAESGLNLFGKVASGFVAGLLKPAPVNLDPNNLFAGVARAKVKDKSVFKVTLSIGSGTVWQNPFGLADTIIKGATVIISSPTPGVKNVETWGTANLKSKKDFTIYVKREDAGASQSLGFDTKDASLDDFLMIVNVAANTLKLPSVPVPGKLPLNMVTLENPVYMAYTDASSIPNFDTMMFKGTQKATGIGELITNTKGKVFKQPVAELKLKASKSGVDGAAAVGVKLGQLDAASAQFYLNIGLPPVTPGMGIKASSLLGALDLQANQSGLSLNVPPKCPIQPLGVTATLDDLSLSHFPLKFHVKDCATQVVKEGVKVVVEGGKLVAEGGKKVGNSVVDTGKKAGEVVVDTGKKAGGAVVDTGKKAGGAVADTGKKVGGAVADTGKKVGGTIRKAKFW